MGRYIAMARSKGECSYMKGIFQCYTREAAQYNNCYRT